MELFSSVLYAEERPSRESIHKMLTEIHQNISISKDRVSLLTNQVDRLKKDQHTLTDELIKIAKEERDVAHDIAEREEKLKKLIEQQMRARQKLQNRQVEFAEVLAILERMGLNPPPALMARPEDVLASIRSSVLLGAVIPDMQKKTLTLTASLKELTHLSYLITEEYESLKIKMQNQAEQRKHLELLIDEKTKLQKKSERELLEQKQKNIDLVKKARSLEELILELEHQSQMSSHSLTQTQTNVQLLERFNFESQKGSLFFPVAGKKIQRLNGNSHTMMRFGEMIETKPDAVVVAPARAIVAFAGPFRSYGQLIILNVGQGYHIVLIGMAKINVTQGQIIFAGEPLGRMGEQFIANTAALDIGKSAPMLYIEFRKRGKPVNPTPWWRTKKSRRNQNDS
ncbi:peptidoglycan DD-metalloendopeptidase family protein [Bartonella sp. F2]|nr:peptidoglycan DD-metalloendopeptidase family protein [Bartonella sp. F02]MCZ2328397.1 peptidoglycan DD-metalloendopeptidase family protein [Bartonella sp. F02]